MECVACGGAAISERPERTAQGYRRFRCRDCGKQFNERTGGSLNRAQYPSDVIALVVFWRLRYKLSLRDLPEMFLLRGIEFTYEAVRDWEAKLTPSLIDNLRRRRGGGSRVRRSWYVDETYIKVNGRWCYLYRAIDRTGALVDVMLSETRIEQDHRGIKSRYGPMRGFGAVNSAARFCRCHDELRNLLHANCRFRHTSPATVRRRRFLQASRIALRVMASS